MVQPLDDTGWAQMDILVKARAGEDHVTIGPHDRICSLRKSTALHQDYNDGFRVLYVSRVPEHVPDGQGIDHYDHILTDKSLALYRSSSLNAISELSQTYVQGQAKHLQGREVPPGSVADSASGGVDFAVPMQESRISTVYSNALSEWLDVESDGRPAIKAAPVSYTHLTLPTKRIV